MKRQGQIIAALVGNFKSVEEALKTAENSMGSAQAEWERFTDSIEYKSNRLGQTMIRFWQNFIDRDIIKRFIDLLNMIANSMDYLINNPISSFILQVGLLSTALMLLSKMLEELAIRFIALTTGATVAEVRVLGLSKAMKTLAFSTSTATAATKSLWVAFLPFLKIALIGAAIYGVIKIFDHFTGVLDRQIESVREFTTEINNLDKEIGDLKAIENRTEKEQQYLELLEKEIEYKKWLRNNELEDVIQKKYFDVQDVEFDATPGAIITDEDQIKYKNGIDLIYEQIHALEELKKEQSSLSLETEEGRKKWREYEKQIIEQENTLNNAAIEIVEYINTFDKIPEHLQDRVDILQELVDYIQGVTNSTDNLTDAEKEALSIQESLNKQQKEALELLEQTTQKYRNLESILKEYNDHGRISFENLTKLISEYPEYVNQLTNEATLHETLIELQKKEEKAVIDAFNKKLEVNEHYFNKTIKDNETLWNTIKLAYEQDYKNFVTIADAKKAVDDKLREYMGEAWLKVYGSTAEGIQKGINELVNSMHRMLPERRKIAKEQIAELEIQLAIVEGIQNAMDFSLDSIDLGEFKSGKSGGKEIKEIAQYLSDDLAKAIDIVNGFLTKSNVELSRYDEASEEYRRELEYQIELQKQLQSFYNQGANKLRDRNKEIKQSSLFQKDWNSLTVKQKEELNKLKKELDDNEKAIQSFGNSWWSAQSIIDDRIFEKITSKGKELSKVFINLDDKLSRIKSEISLLVPHTKEYTNKLQEQVNTTKEYISALQTLLEYYQIELSSGELNIAQKNQLIAKIKEIEQSLFDMQITLRSQLAAQANEVISIYKDMYSKQKDIALNAIDDQIKAEEKRHKTVSDNLDNEISRYEDLIRAKLEALEREADEESYIKQLTKAQEEEREIRSKINILSLDDSLEARVIEEKLAKELAEKLEYIEDLKNKHTLKTRKENLNDLLNSHKKQINDKKKTEDNIFNLEKERLERSREEVQKYWDNMINDERRWGQLRVDIMNGNLKEVKNSFNAFTGILNSNLDFLGTSIVHNLIDKMEMVKQSINSINLMSSNLPSKFEPSKFEKDSQIKKGMTLRESAAIADVSVGWNDKTRIITLNGETFHTVPGTTLDSSSGYHVVIDPELVKKVLLSVGGKFHEGGIVGDSSNKTLKLIDKLFNTKLGSNEVIVKALKEELFVPSKNIFNNFIPNMQKLISVQQPSVAGNNNIINKFNFYIDRLTGDKAGAKTLFKEFITEYKRRGGKF